MKVPAPKGLKIIPDPIGIHLEVAGILDHHPEVAEAVTWALPDLHQVEAVILEALPDQAAVVEVHPEEAAARRYKFKQF